MEASQIRKWRPQSFADFAGVKNQKTLQVYQRFLLEDNLPSPLLIVAPYGHGKTSLARHFMRSLGCTNRNPQTADLCSACPACHEFSGIDGDWSFFINGPFRRVMLNAARLSAKEVRSEIVYVFDSEHDALFVDEIHRLEETRSQETLLTYFEDFPGIFIAALMSDRFEEILPPLRERCEILSLQPPTTAEMADFLYEKCHLWSITTVRETVELLVKESGQSFRRCQQCIARAAAINERRLNPEIVWNFFGGTRASSPPAATGFFETAEDALGGI